MADLELRSWLAEHLCGLKPPLRPSGDSFYTANNRTVPKYELDETACFRHVVAGMSPRRWKP